MNRGGLAAVLALAVATSASAQQPGSSPRFAQPPPPRRGETRPQPPVVVATPIAPTRDLRAHFGADMAARLLRSSDADERLRGLARAAEVGGPQGIALLGAALEAAGAGAGSARQDPRALIEVARGLARSLGGFEGGRATDQSAARTWLAQIVGIGLPPRGMSRDGDDPDGPARFELAREIAAFALAQSDDPRSADALVPIARGSGPGQAAATLALAAFPPQASGSVAGATTPQALRLAALLGDLRSLDVVRGAIKSSDPGVRAAALLAAGELGDTRSIDLARAALAERDPRVRAAAAEALVLLDAPDKHRAVESLLGEDATAPAGARLAERAQDAGVAKALAARVVSTQDEAARTAGVLALGRGASAEAVQALTAFLANPLLAGDAAGALAQSPSRAALPALEAAAAQPATRRLAVRAYVVRALARGERSARLDETIATLGRAADPKDRALSVFARVALRDARAADFLADREPRVRRAAAMAALVDPSPATLRVLLARAVTEADDATRAVLSTGLLDGDPDGRLTTSALVDRAESGGPDAPLAAMALARRADGAHDAKVDLLLASRDPLLRAHVARGLGMGEAKDAAGRLAAAWAYEPNVAVRRAIVGALAARAADQGSPARTSTLRVAARLDPDATVRFVAARALEGRAPGVRPTPVPEVAWLRVATDVGASPVPDSGPPFTGALVRADGLAVPIAFDDDGYALVPGVPPGEGRLVLAPRVPQIQDVRP